MIYVNTGILRILNSNDQVLLSSSNLRFFPQIICKSGETHHEANLKKCEGAHENLRKTSASLSQGQSSRENAHTMPRCTPSQAI